VESKSSLPGVTDLQDPTFDPEEDGLDYHESLEGMLVRINEAVAVGPTTDSLVNASRPRGLNSEIAVVADRGRNAGVRTARGGVVVRALDSRLPQEYRVGDFNPERLILSDQITREQGQVAPVVHTGGTFGGPIMAVVDYSFGNFKYLVLGWPAADPGNEQREVTSAERRNELSVATYNVENLDPVRDRERINVIARHIVQNLRSPDILGLQEIQDLDGEGPLGPSGDPTFTALAAAIVTAGGPSYDFRQIDPVHNADGGVPNGNIRVGLMFRIDRGLAFVDRPGGTPVTPTEDDPALPGAQLTFSPGRIEPTNPVFANSRKPLVGEFRFRRRKLFVVVNHLNSKGGDAPLMGRFQEPMRPTEIQRRGVTRPLEDRQRGQAGVINAWVRRLLAADRWARVIVLGDMNDFDFSETSQVLERGRDTRFELVNLWRFLRLGERYSYVFEGNSQALDHILVSPSLLLARPQLDAVRVNADFFDKASDHDPLIVRFLLGGDDDGRKDD
jgi:endonuclease/exonuclease/phosphatase family metal-dependent hydrolase